MGGFKARGHTQRATRQRFQSEHGSRSAARRSTVLPSAFCFCRSLLLFLCLLLLLAASLLPLLLAAAAAAADACRSLLLLAAALGHPLEFGLLGIAFFVGIRFWN